MGKNFGTNSKAEEGRARKAAAKEAEKEKQRAEKQKLEDKKWEEGKKDDSKKRAEEAKRLEKLIKKQELRSLEQQEEKELAKYKPVKNSGGKATHLTTATSSSSFKSISLNWSLSASDDGSSVTTEAYSASNIDDALLLLESANTSTTSMTIEKHPERRVKAAFAAYEARELPILKAENPGLRHTQLMERLHKMWQKAPENPFNQLHVAHNATREEQTKILQDDVDRNLDRLRIN